jgi:hypothetical protein
MGGVEQGTVGRNPSAMLLMTNLMIVDLKFQCGKTEYMKLLRLVYRSEPLDSRTATIVAVAWRYYRRETCCLSKAAVNRSISTNCHSRPDF